VKLNPAYCVYFGKGDVVTIGDTLKKIYRTFETEEPGSAARLKKFIATAQNNYEVAIKDLVYRPGASPFELVTPVTVRKLGQFFSTVKKEVRKAFSNPKLVAILEFPVLFLGAKPGNTPAFYSFMNYADFGLGTFHPVRGMYSVIGAMEKLALSLGVKIETHAPVEKISVSNKTATHIVVNGKQIKTDIVVSGADYHHTETLLEKPHRQYSERYWEKKVFAPSSLLFYVGFNKKIDNVQHHTLFFDVAFETHASCIYDDPQWPEKPLFYASFPSITDTTVAPTGKEAAIFLIPLAPGIKDTPQIRAAYFDKIIARFENLTDQDVRNFVIFKKSFCVNDFVNDYNSYKGNAYGLANTLSQTAFLRPKLKSKKVKMSVFFIKSCRY
ncbi:MAG: phytoene desaturase family protein, partial [Marinirhabdus sp.]